MDSIQANFQDGVFEDGYIWVFDNCIQAICRIKITNFEMEIISVYEGEEKFIVRKIFSFRDKFFLVSKSALKILIYDRKVQQGRTPFYMQETLISKAIKWYEAYLYNDRIYFFSTDGEAIWYEITSKKYYEDKFFMASIKKKAGKKKLVIKRPYQYGSAVWFVVYGTSHYGKYDMDQSKLFLYQVKESDAHLDQICFDGQSIWITSINDTDIICKGKQKIKVLEKQSYARLGNVNKWIIIFLKYNSKLILMNKETYEIVTIKLSSNRENELNEKYNSKIVNFHEYNENIYLFQRDRKKLYILNQKNWEVKQVQLKCENYIEKYIETKKYIFDEEEYIDLKCLIQIYIRNINSKYRKDNEIGRNVWKAITTHNC